MSKSPKPAPEEPTVVVTVRLPREDVEELRRREAETEVSVARQIRRAIREALTKKRVIR